MKTVLLIGGPGDGHRVQVNEFAKFVTMPSHGPHPGDHLAGTRDTYPAVHYQIVKFRGQGYECLVATLGTDPRDPMQIMFESYGKAGA